MDVHPVTDIGIPELRPFRTLRRPQEQHAQGLFIAEGEKVVTRLFASGLRVLSVLLTDEWFALKRDEIASLPSSPRVFTGSKALLEDIVGYNLHQGIMALAGIPPPPDLGELLRTDVPAHLFVAIDDLVNAENVGIIVRNARAFGATGILVGETSSSPWLRRSVRNSLGAVFSIPIIQSEDLAATVRSLSRQNGFLSLAAETQRDGAPIDAMDLRGHVCIVVGGEDRGMREAVVTACDRVVEVPMMQGVDSVNVANAAAVCLYEVQRQRRG